MATEPVTTSPCYDPGAAYNAPVGRLPVLGKMRAEIDKIRAEAANALNQIKNRDLAQIDSNTKITAELAALATQTADNTRKIDSDIANDALRVTNETNKVTGELAALATQTINDTTRTANDTTRATNDTNKTIGELDALATKTASETGLLDQKTETEKAQVMDVVSSGTVVGVIGKQKALFQKQTDGFDRDAEQKLVKIMVDTWSVRQTTDGADPLTAGLAEADIATVIAKARSGISAPVV